MKLLFSQSTLIPLKKSECTKNPLARFFESRIKKHYKLFSLTERFILQQFLFYFNLSTIRGKKLLLIDQTNTFYTKNTLLNSSLIILKTIPVGFFSNRTLLKISTSMSNLVHFKEVFAVISFSTLQQSILEEVRNSNIPFFYKPFEDVNSNLNCNFAPIQQVAKIVPTTYADVNLKAISRYYKQNYFSIRLEKRKVKNIFFWKKKYFGRRATSKALIKKSFLFLTYGKIFKQKTKNKKQKYKLKKKMSKNLKT